MTLCLRPWHLVYYDLIGVDAKTTKDPPVKGVEEDVVGDCPQKDGLFHDFCQWLVWDLCLLPW